MGLTKEQKFWGLVSELRRRFPVRKLVVVKRHQMKAAGSACWNGKRFTILINRNHSWKMQRDTLMHEWAHIRTWFSCKSKDDHSCRWGAEYAKIYRSFIHDAPLEPELRRG